MTKNRHLAVYALITYKIFNGIYFTAIVDLIHLLGSDRDFTPDKPLCSTCLFDCTIDGLSGVKS